MNRPRFRGFGMIEMFATLALTIAFFLVTARLFSTTMRQLSDVPAAGNEIAAIEQIRGMMTQDVWNAVDIQQPSADLLLLLDGRGELTQWQRHSDGRLTRSAEHYVNAWNSAPTLEFALSDTGAVIRQKDRTWTFASPLKMTGRKP